MKFLIIAFLCVSVSVCLCEYMVEKMCLCASLYGGLITYKIRIAWREKFSLLKLPYL